ncbi:MAG: hypothetical protein RL488_98 [Actinomycetota bacterium]|jgi:hypothetical protein
MAQKYKKYVPKDNANASADEPQTKGLERFQANMKKLDDRVFGRFYNSRFGVAWKARVAKVRTWHLGRFNVGKFLPNVVGLVVWICLGALAINAVDQWSLTWNDYQLTQAQKDAGYSVTYEPRYKHDTLDDVANRFFSDAEEQTTPTCEAGVACWDFKLIPLNGSCQVMHVTMKFFETDNFLASSIDQVDKDFKADSGVFAAGHEYDYRLGSSKPKAEYGQIDRAYCKTYSGN